MPASELIFYVNGKKVTDGNVDPERTLLHYLRTKLGLTGTKLACGEGGCGSCTVMVSRYDRREKKIKLCHVHGAAVTTVEGLGSVDKGLHPIQERLAKSNGIQCGFCIPGMVMSMYTLLRNNTSPSAEVIEKELEGNLCRCTGYRPILDTFQTFTNECSLGENCCRQNPQPPEGVLLSSEVFGTRDFSPYDPTQEPIFPPELQLADKFDGESLTFVGERVTWYRPVRLSELLSLKAKYPDARFVHGNTDMGIYSKTTDIPVLISLTHLPELSFFEIVDDGIRIGASTSLTYLEDVIKTKQEALPAYQRRTFEAILEIVSRIGNRQIRNVATVGGNIMTASPVSDLNPLLMATKSTMTYATSDGTEKTVPVNQSFFTENNGRPAEHGVLIGVKIPFTRKHEYIRAYKQSLRTAGDRATVNATIRVLLGEDSEEVQDISLCFGGLSSTTINAESTAKRSVGRVWNEDLVTDVCQWLSDDVTLIPGSPGGVTAYRQTLAGSLFFRFYMAVKCQHYKYVGKTGAVLSSQLAGCEGLKRGESTGTVSFEDVASAKPEQDTIGRSISLPSNITHTTGESIFVDDMPTFSNELHLARVLSTKAHAKIVSVDAAEALRMPGVVDIVTHKDVPGSNLWGMMEHDEELFASCEVLTQGQTIAAIVADTPEHAQRAARAVQIEYEELDIVITMEDAIKKGSFYGKRVFTDGDIEVGFREADHILEETLYMGGQEQFYLEPQSCVAIPLTEYRHMERVVADALGVPANHVICKAKRLGGGFGGKLTRSCPFMGISAVAANKTGRPVRCVLDRDEDLSSSGARHPYQAKYKLGFTSDGRVTALDMDMYCNGGFSMDASIAYLEKGIFHITNGYKIPNIRVTGYACKTNIPSNTPMRSFAVVPAIISSESWMTDIAIFLGVSQEKIREINMYREGDITHLGQTLTNYYLPRAWKECLEKSDYYNRKREVELFNSGNRWKKRGLAVTVAQQGICNAFVFANQAGALVQVYLDGSVLLSHGGSEMGQSLYTKMIQIASRELGIPHSLIHTAATSSETVPNCSPTGASIGADVNGMAVVAACRTIMDRLEEFISANPTGTWKDWVEAAYYARKSLSATGFYKTPDIDVDMDTLHGNLYRYFVTGAGCCEVEIDCLTGDTEILRADLVMDAGHSINPAVDIGQIQGAFVQGCGLALLEQQKVSPTGYHRTRGPNTYKIPTTVDIPLEFNVHMLKDAPNPKAVYSSKGVGEASLGLGFSALFAVKDAIMSARRDSGINDNFRLHSPATPDRVRMACKDKFTDQNPEAEKGSFVPWYVDL